MQKFLWCRQYLIKKSIKKQTAKYVDEYGFGSIFFSLNFSEKLNFDSVLVL